MKKRIKQFFTQCFSKMNQDDIAFVCNHLNEQEQKLFFQLSVLNQKHSVSVTYTLLTLKPNISNILIKAALLHDIGKINSNLTITNKILAITLHHFFPKISLQFAKKNPNHFLHYYFFHPQIGVQHLKDIHSNAKIIHIVAAHHEQSLNLDVQLLQQADELN